MTYTIAQRFEFSAGHKTHGKAMHGHNYILHVFAQGDIKHAILQRSVQNWLDDYWAYGFIYHKDDATMFKMFKDFTEHKSYALGNEPTVKHMAEHIMDVCKVLFVNENVNIVKVTLEATKNDYIEITL